MTEVELKFLLDEDGEKRLRNHAALRRMTRGRASTAELLTVYHDTPDWSLRDAQIALRLRRAGGRWIQTVKLGRALTGGLSNAREIETEVGEDRIDLDLIADPAVRDTILSALDGQSFGPVARTEIRRTTRTLEHAGSLIEFALDRGEVVAGDRREPLCEAEFELVEGDVMALFEVAAIVFDRGLVRFSERTKAERGYMLATNGRIAEPPAVRKARTVALTEKMSAEEALCAIFAECLEQIALNARLILDSDDSEGPHQLRIGLRRLRTAIRLLPKQSVPPRLAALNDEARRLGQVTGAVRDLDVMREDVLAPHAEELPKKGVKALDEALAARGDAARKKLRETLVEARTQSFLIDVAAVAAAGLRVRRSGDIGAEHLDRPAGEFMEAALVRAWKRVAKRAKGIADLEPEQRHELRKALKALRYAAEFAEALYGRNVVRPFLKQMKALQDVFGELNDLTMAEAQLLGDDPPAAEDPKAQLAAGLLVGGARLRAEHSWEGAKAAWKTLRKTGAFW